MANAKIEELNAQAERGDSESCCELAMMYYQRADGILPNYVEVVRLLFIAARNNYPLGQFHLGVMYQRGHGISRSNLHAYMWISIAISNDNNSLFKSTIDSIAKLMSPELIKVAQDAADLWIEEYRKDNP